MFEDRSKICGRVRAPLAGWKSWIGAESPMTSGWETSKLVFIVAVPASRAEAKVNILKVEPIS